MEEIEFVCLANSWREGGRCIAGIRTNDWLTWIRPVPSGNGPLTEAACRNVGLFDVVRVEVTGPCPDKYQPENWELVNDRIRVVRKLSEREQMNVLRAGQTRGPDLFGNRFDRVPAKDFEDHTAAASLATIKPDALEWHVQVRQRRQVRARFELSGVSYDLAVTDPVWHERFDSVQPGSKHPRSFGGVSTKDSVFMTVSMGAPYNESCYKFVAAVFIVYFPASA